MKPYIFATDFSENALAALFYTLPFIKRLNGSLILFHAFDYANPYVEVPAFMMEEMNEALEKKAKDQLREWQQMALELEPSLSCSYHAEQGPFVRSLLELSEQEKAGAIFMGTKGASGLKRLFMGTNTASVIESANCPVLAIPTGVAYTGINHIVFATDYQEEHALIMDQLAAIAIAFEAKLEILHITVEGVQADLEVYDWYQEIVKERLAHLDVAFRVIKKKSVHEGIENYVILNQPDLLVMAMHQRNWIERMLKGSNSKRQAYLTKKPLLVLHEGVKEKV